MRIRVATLDDFEDVTKMYKELIKTVYKGFEIKEDIFFYATVTGWYDRQYSIMVSEKDDGTLTGFSMCHIEDIKFIEPYIKGELAYVKPEYRKGRSAYLLYNNIVELAKNMNLPLISSGFIGGGEVDKIDRIMSKFGQPLFKEFVRFNK
jgi:hypothetical protein